MVFNHWSVLLKNPLWRHVDLQSFLHYREIEDRLEAVTELTNADSAIFIKFAEILSSLPDVEKALTTIIHGKVL